MELLKVMLILDIYKVFVGHYNLQDISICGFILLRIRAFESMQLACFIAISVEVKLYFFWVSFIFVDMLFKVFNKMVTPLSRPFLRGLFS